ncbi:hypothetical protein BGW37DRAFT_470396 [Umbelopsis sp. PMI_123]|nr:hypothetical protein BGW37DRAFT_470396 [Umbelopsis sp. PMI_123]
MGKEHSQNFTLSTRFQQPQAHAQPKQVCQTPMAKAHSSMSTYYYSPTIENYYFKFIVHEFNGTQIVSATFSFSAEKCTSSETEYVDHSWNKITSISTETVDQRRLGCSSFPPILLQIFLLKRMHIFKPQVENILGEKIIAFANLDPPTPSVTARYMKYDYRRLLEQLEKYNADDNSNDTRHPVAKYGEAAVVDISSWIMKRASSSDVQPLNLFTGERTPTSSSDIDPCTIPFVNFTQLSEPSLFASYVPHTTRDKPLTSSSSSENPDDNQTTANRGTTPSNSVITADGSVPSDHAVITSNSTAQHNATFTKCPSPTDTQTNHELADLASTTSKGVIYFNNGNHLAEQVEQAEDVIGENLDETPHFILRHSQKQPCVDSAVASNEQAIPSMEPIASHRVMKGTTILSENVQDPGEVLNLMSEDKVQDRVDIPKYMDGDRVQKPAHSTKVIDVDIEQEPLFTIIPSNPSHETMAQNVEYANTHMEKDKSEEPSDSMTSIVPNETGISQQAPGLSKPIESEIRQEPSTLDNNTAVPIDIDNTPDDHVVVNAGSSTVTHSPEYTRNSDNSTTVMTEPNEWVYRSTNLEVLEPAILYNRKRKAVEKDDGHVYSKQICFSPHHIYVVRPNAWNLWQDQEESNDNDIQMTEEITSVREVKGIITNEEYSRRLKFLKLEYEMERKFVDDQEMQAMQQVQTEYDSKRDAIAEAYETELLPLQSAWQGHQDQTG